MIAILKVTLTIWSNTKMINRLSVMVLLFLVNSCEPPIYYERIYEVSNRSNYDFLIKGWSKDTLFIEEELVSNRDLELIREYDRLPNEPITLWINGFFDCDSVDLINLNDGSLLERYYNTNRVGNYSNPEYNIYDKNNHLMEFSIYEGDGYAYSKYSFIVVDELFD